MIEKISFFSSKRDFYLFILVSSFILFYSLLIEYNEYKKFTHFDSQITQVTVLKQYEKIKKSKTTQVLKLKTIDGITFYTSFKKPLQNLKGKKINIEVYGGKINFYEYLTYFYAYTKVKYIHENITLKEKLNLHISSSHTNQDISSIYQALYTASPLPKKLQTTFSALGVSHLLAISGFHLGVLSALLFFFLKPIYNFFQNSYFPYRNSKFDLFSIVIITLFVYLLFLDSPPSLVRAFGMLLVGFILYDRGIKIISLQTLFITVLLLLCFFPKLLFALGFWLSVSGVFYIFLFLIHFKHLSKIWQFILVPFWVYLLMLPFSLVIFGNFSIYHPLSIIWTSLFTFFYPISIFLHLIGFGDLFDSLLESLILLARESKHVELSSMFLIIQISISLFSIFDKRFIYALLTFSFGFFIYAIYHIT
ncbi:MAG: ComEC/Rec2 family competence protein [Sulfurimonas sp.]|nr:ComEC/Rec2 family competence protein [Sulfurimonas sp.]